MMKEKPLITLQLLHKALTVHCSPEKFVRTNIIHIPTNGHSRHAEIWKPKKVYTFYLVCSLIILILFSMLAFAF